MVLHQGWLYYVVDNENDTETIQWPNPTLFEVGNSDLASFTVKERVHAITRAAILNTLSKEVQRAQSDGQLQLKEFKFAIFHRSRTYGHLFWGINGANNIFIRLCKYFHVCSPEEIQSTAILGPNLFPIVPNLRIGLGKHIKAVGDVMRCFGPVIGINHPDSVQGKSRPDVTVMTFKKVLAGIGEEVNEPLSAKGPNEEIRYVKPNASLALMRTQYLRRCAGLPATPAPLTGVSILLVNRPHGGGRHIIGLDEVYDRLVRELPEDVKVRLYYPRSENISDQAAVFNSANIVVVPHGAANTNFAFLPHTAIIFAVYAVSGRHALDLDHAEALPRPPYNVTVISINCSSKLVLLTSRSHLFPLVKKP